MNPIIDLEAQQIIDLYFAVRRNIDEGNKALAELLLPAVRDSLIGHETMKIPLTRGFYADIDCVDFDLVRQYNWFVMETKKVNECIYAGTRIRNADGSQTTMRMHRLVLNETDDEIMIDHRDNDGLRNVRSNLRRATRKENRRNSRKRHGASSKYLGVSIDNSRVRAGKTGIWQVSIGITESGIKRKIKLGTFADEVEAAQAYNAKAIEIFGEFASLNPV